MSVPYFYGKVGQIAKYPKALCLKMCWSSNGNPQLKGDLMKLTIVALVFRPAYYHPEKIVQVLLVIRPFI